MIAGAFCLLVGEGAERESLRSSTPPGLGTETGLSLGLASAAGRRFRDFAGGFLAAGEASEEGADCFEEGCAALLPEVFLGDGFEAAGFGEGASATESFEAACVLLLSVGACAAEAPSALAPVERRLRRRRRF